MQLNIKLRDGFRNDTVSMALNGTEVYRKPGVTTDLTISYADGLEAVVTDPVVSLSVAVEGGPVQQQEIHVQETPFVDVWIIDGQMKLQASHEETPML